MARCCWHDRAGRNGVPPQVALAHAVARVPAALAILFFDIAKAMLTLQGFACRFIVQWHALCNATLLQVQLRSSLSVILGGRCEEKDAARSLQGE